MIKENPYIQLKQYEGKTLKYREICDIIGEEYKRGGGQLRSQINRWSKFIKYKKLSRGKYLIQYVYTLKDDYEYLESVYSRKRGQYKQNDYIDMGNYLKCYTNDGVEFLIDKEDKWVLEYSCSVVTGGYIANSKRERIHRLIMNPPDDMWVDHINGDRTDNRKQNLRIVTPEQNSWNRKPHKDKEYRGITKLNGKYYVMIPFDNKEDAIEFRKNWELDNYGEYSYYNRCTRICDVESIQYNIK